MKLDAALEKVVIGKPFGLTMVKGAQGTGKTTAAACRALYLKSSYCIYEDEKVLVASKESGNIAQLKSVYEEAKNDYNCDYATLFSLFKQEPVDFYTLEELVDKYYSVYAEDNKLNFTLIGEEEKLNIIGQCISELKGKYKNVRIIRNHNENFIISEIDWIKACDIESMEEYKECSRLGRVCGDRKGPNRLLRNSRSREAIFEIMLLYNRKLASKNMIDHIDKEKMALKSIQSREIGLYTHMIVDNAQKLTRIQLYILMALKSKKAYSSMMLLVDHKAEVCNGAWLVKGRRQGDLGFDTTIKNCYLKKSFVDVKEVVPVTVEPKPDKKKTVNDFMEKYVFVDVRHKRSFEFSRDTSNYDELILNHGKEDVLLSKEELTSLPVYSNIAAGEPITINPDMVDTFDIPHYWVKGMRDCFMLRVKGDSMIGADIEDGDFVVIRRQNTASNRDIVAVDIEGSATLKRLWFGKEEVLLMPENEKYSPIHIKDREAVILGIVVGIIKNAA